MAKAPEKGKKVVRRPGASKVVRRDLKGPAGKPGVADAVATNGAAAASAAAESPPFIKGALSDADKERHLAANRQRQVDGTAKPAVGDTLSDKDLDTAEGIAESVPANTGIKEQIPYLRYVLIAGGTVLLVVLTVCAALYFTKAEKPHVNAKKAAEDGKALMTDTNSAGEALPAPQPAPKSETLNKATGGNTVVPAKGTAPVVDDAKAKSEKGKSDKAKDAAKKDVEKKKGNEKTPTRVAAKAATAAPTTQAKAYTGWQATFLEGHKVNRTKSEMIDMLRKGKVGHVSADTFAQRIANHGHPVAPTASALIELLESDKVEVVPCTPALLKQYYMERHKGGTEFDSKWIREECYSGEQIVMFRKSDGTLQAMFSLGCGNPMPRREPLPTPPPPSAPTPPPVTEAPVPVRVGLDCSAPPVNIPAGRQAYDGNVMDWDRFPPQLKQAIAEFIARSPVASHDVISRAFQDIVKRLGLNLASLPRWSAPTELIYVNGQGFQNGTIRDDAIIGGNPGVSGYNRQLLVKHQWEREVVIKVKTTGGNILSPESNTLDGYRWLRLPGYQIDQANPKPRDCGVNFYILVSRQQTRISNTVRETAPARKVEHQENAPSIIPTVEEQPQGAPSSPPVRERSRPDSYIRTGV